MIKRPGLLCLDLAACRGVVLFRYLSIPNLYMAELTGVTEDVRLRPKTLSRIETAVLAIARAILILIRPRRGGRGIWVGVSRGAEETLDAI